MPFGGGPKGPRERCFNLESTATNHLAEGLSHIPTRDDASSEYKFNTKHDVLLLELRGQHIPIRSVAPDGFSSVVSSERSFYLPDKDVALADEGWNLKLIPVDLRLRLGKNHSLSIFLNSILFRLLFGRLLLHDGLYRPCSDNSSEADPLGSEA